MRMTEPGKGPAFVGTFNGHAISVAAAAATLPILATGSVQKEMASRCGRLKATFESLAGDHGIPAKFATGGSHFHWYFCDNPIDDFRTAAKTDAHAYRDFTASLGENRLLTLPNPLSHHAISLGHGDTVLDELESAFSEGLKALSD